MLSFPLGSFFPSLGMLLAVSMAFSAGFAPGIAEGAETNLSKALKSGKKTIEFSGKENDAVTIPKGVRVVGASPEKAVINDDVVMENGASLENVTINGKVNAVTAARGAGITLINVTVRGAAEAGIFAPKGGGSVTLKDSRVLKNRKGLYLLNGTAVQLTGNAIRENQEEGADMHSGIRGAVSGNIFEENGEGGMEIIINGSAVVLSENSFTGNRSSGLALQSYSGGGGGQKTGDFQITRNAFSGNGNFGIDCKNPQGGGANSYFPASVQASDNAFAGNRLGTVSGSCLFQSRTTPKVPEEGAEREAEEAPPEEPLEEALEPVAEPVTEAIPTESFAQALLGEAETLQAELEAAQAENIFWRWLRFRERREARRDAVRRLEHLAQEQRECQLVASRELSLVQAERTCTEEEAERLERITGEIGRLLSEDPFPRWLFPRLGR